MMRPAWMIVRRELRRGWGGADSAIDRSQAPTNETQVEVEASLFGDLGRFSESLARLPSSADLAGRRARVDGVTMFDFMGATPDLTLSGLANALATGSRLGRHDLAVARARGLRPRRAAATVCWQAVVVTVAGALLGVLLGLISGRLVSGRVARGTGPLVETVVPAWAGAAAPCVALLVALAVAAVPAARIAGVRPAESLRTE